MPSINLWKPLRVLTNCALKARIYGKFLKQLGKTNQFQQRMKQNTTGCICSQYHALLTMNLSGVRPDSSAQLA